MNHRLIIRLRGLPWLILLLFIVETSVQGISTIKGHFKTFRFVHEGRDRMFLLYQPEIKKTQSTIPLLIFIHGGGGSARSSVKLTENRFNELADKDGFLVAYAQAVDKNWNDGRKGDFAEAIEENIDDVGYFRKLIKMVSENFMVDTNQIYACGISNGGFMTARLACEMNTQIKAVAIVSATMSEDFSLRCHPQHLPRLLVMNGTADPLVPYNGGEVTVFRQTRGKVIATDALVSFWCNTDHCNENPEVSSLPDLDTEDGTRVEKQIYRNNESNNEVVLYKIIGGGHSWPGGYEFFSERLVGKTCRDINACDEIWEFFRN